MDMEGRSLGTERPPTSTSPGAGHHGASTAAGRFSEYLGSKTSEAASATRGAREEVEDDVAARIRDGRTDAADEVRRREAAVRDDQQVRDDRADAARGLQSDPSASVGDDGSQGTVGAVALDLQGHLAAATSTGGVDAKAAGGAASASRALMRRNADTGRIRSDRCKPPSNAVPPAPPEADRESNMTDSRSGSVTAFD